MGLNLNWFKKKKIKEIRKDLFIVGYDCGVDGSEVVEVVSATDFERAIKYAEEKATYLYEYVYDLAPSPIELSYGKFDILKSECLLNAIGFWCKEFDRNNIEDKKLMLEYGITEI